jgi:hypothetical protein
MTMPSHTNKSDQRDLKEGGSTPSTERRTTYNMWFTDGYADKFTELRELIGSGLALPSETPNDDSYRVSRHLLNKVSAISNAPSNLDYISRAEDNLREHSLARQLQDRDDGVATIRLIRRRTAVEISKPGGGEMRVPWINLIPPNTKFFLQQVQENRKEKVQIIDTFGEWIAFFFGSQPEVYNYSGTLLNAKNHNWKSEFQENYEHFLRGSQAVKFRATMLLQYDDVVVEGYMLDCSTSLSANEDKAVPFSFNLLVTNRSPLDPRSMIGLRWQRSMGTAAEAALYSSMNELLALTTDQRVDKLETFYLMREYFSGNYIEAAGTATNRGGKIETDTGREPGQKGGLNPARSKPSPYKIDEKQIDANPGNKLPSDIAGLIPLA